LILILFIKGSRALSRRHAISSPSSNELQSA
jgi:hypothetical protein